NEGDRQQRRFLASLIEAHGEQAENVVVDMLSQTPSAAANKKNWYFTRNLIYLLGRLAAQDPNLQQKAVKLISPYLTSPVFQLRIAALTSFEGFSTEEMVNPLTSVFKRTCYSEKELKNSERVTTYLSTAVNLVGKFNGESALRALVDIASGRLIDFIPEKLV